ncbi:hypothetical protein AAKU52_002467 [Pedobacter sp. CG_S7]|uniref:hypothetical protein n=1 Tax=Pedobacter sp. CG_S7 TaxID=3143930 RepID=UPI0033948BE1
MKKLIILLFAGAVMLFVETKSASAQIKLAEIEIFGTTNKTAISEKVTKSFNQIFKDAESPKWYVSNKQIIVNFILNDQRNKAVFEKNGRLVYNLVFGVEGQMPAEVRKVVKSKYFDYKINSTVKVNTEGRSIWIVNISDPKEIMVLRVEDGTMDVMDKFVNSGV